MMWYITTSHGKRFIATSVPDLELWLATLDKDGIVKIRIVNEDGTDKMTLEGDALKEFIADTLS